MVKDERVLLPVVVIKRHLEEQQDLKKPLVTKVLRL